MSRKIVGLWGLVMVLALMGVGTINNQLRINKANAVLAAQAQAGQKALDRQCQLFPVGKKLYRDMLVRGKITADDYELVLSTANTACSNRP